MVFQRTIEIEALVRVATIRAAVSAAAMIAVALLHHVFAKKHSCPVYSPNCTITFDSDIALCTIPALCSICTARATRKNTFRFCSGLRGISEFLRVSCNVTVPSSITASQPPVLTFPWISKMSHSIGSPIGDDIGEVRPEVGELGASFALRQHLR